VALETGLSKLQQVDWLGNLIFTPSMVAILLGLVMAGIQYPWSSWRVFLPLVLGLLGRIAFHIQQSLPTTKYPACRPAFQQSNVRNGICSDLYLQCGGSSVIVFSAGLVPSRMGYNGVAVGRQFLTFAIGTLFFAVIGGVLLSKIGTYRPLHASAFDFSAIGTGLFTLLDASSTVKWAIFQFIASVGSGTAPRTFGYIWGVTVPSIIFNAVFNNSLSIIPSASLRVQLKDGKAYAFASQVHLLNE